MSNIGSEQFKRDDNLLQPGFSEEDLQQVIRSTYRQVLGNVGITDAMRLKAAESQLRNGRISVKEFATMVASSDLYRSIYYDKSAPVRYVEITYSHLLGRPPRDQLEVQAAIEMINSQGVDAFVANLVQSREYDSAFGLQQVPSVRTSESKVGEPQVSFNRTYKLTHGPGSSDTIDSTSKLENSIQGKGDNKIRRYEDVTSGFIFSHISRKGKLSPFAWSANYADFPDTRTQKYNLGVGRELDTDPVVLSPSRDNIDEVINMAYRHVFGGIGIYAADRCERSESELRNGQITVQSFVQELGKSDVYQRLFLDRTTPHRFVEFNFKHFLGRPPIDEAEISEHVKLLRQQGYKAEINSYATTDEYAQTFGEDTVPYLRSIFTIQGLPQDTFNKTFRLTPGAAGSDFGSIVGTTSRTIGDLLGYPSYSIQLPSSGFPLPKTTGFANNKFSGSVPVKSTPWASFGVGEQDQTRFERFPNSTAEDNRLLLYQIYKFVLGNPHLMSAQRDSKLESRFINGQLSVKEFVRHLCKSQLYLDRFFSGCAPYRFIELCFKHILGRAPADQQEIGPAMDVVVRKGVDAAIDHLMNSGEYDMAFGEDVVPYLRGISTGEGRSMATFNRTLATVGGYAGTDKAQKKSTLVDLRTDRTIPACSNAVSGAIDAAGKRYEIVVSGQRAGSRRRLATSTYVVSGDNISSQLAFIHRSSGRIVSVMEIT
ncbi:MAG: hypothetical protein ERJ67_09845 [Aphanocapsa feldmannii 277cV]|uniref:Phycobilisome linker polypeptide n=1 Tax=Aphanocapsa feldmannii 277cV TaxID=2507553 RepID=A0A524RLN4_9CHRO|nr:MAG: hypothetical protein ERJ67_09845 [Aphanocapsa feldmannii 277cV]